MQYFGGKQRICKYIAEAINDTHTHTQYVEPFCGSCNVASKVNIKNKILNDKNNYLIHMFKELQNGWIPPDLVTEEDYKLARINQDKEPHVAGFIGFACSFAGKFWGGYARDKKGENSGNYALRGKNSILKKMETLMNSEFSCKDFLELNFENSLIYCDPPYRNTTSYYKKILGEFPYDKFIDWVKEQSKNNTVIISEYKHNVPDGATIIMEIPSKTSIRDKGGNVIETTEILFTYNNLQKHIDSN